MAISTTNFLSEVILFIRDGLRNNITDPISSNRSSKSKFVMTSYPRRETQYPIITILGGVDSSRKLGQQSEKTQIELRIEVKIWARNEGEKNDLFGEVYNFLEKNQYPASTSNTSTNVELWDFELLSATDVDDPGEEGIKSKLCFYKYMYIT